MAADIDFSKHSNVLKMVSEAQDANDDMREQCREAKLFLNKRNGQWDPDSWSKLEGRFRGTFDMCTPIVKHISGEIEQSDYSLNVSPAGGDSSIEVAKTYDGLIRNIKNVSNADAVFNAASHSNVIGGFDAVEVVDEFIDGDSFDTSLIIKRIPNAVDSVWFDLGSVERSASDAKWCVKLISIPTAIYNELYPKGSGKSVNDSTSSEAFTEKAEAVAIGHLYYKKKVNIDLVEMTNGAVYQKDSDEFKAIVDELSQDGITVKRERARKSWRVHLRMFDGGGWLAKEEETVFNDLPIIPIYGNFDVFENKLIYFGEIEKLYDPQRIVNYGMSRDTEDGALSPRRKYWATGEQIEGYEKSIQTLNTNNEALQQYNHVEGTPPPFVQGGVEASSGLQATIQNAQQMIAASANQFNAQQGNANPNQSGIAGNQQIEQGNIGTIHWFKAKEVMECQVGKVLINAMPRVYGKTRQERILEEDGTSSMVMLNDNIFDADTQTNVEINNLSAGTYDIVCDFGPAFNSQQKETTQAFLDMAAIDPTFLQQGKDIMLKNLSVPGMDQMAERARVELLNQGLIPESQWTDEERQQIQAQQEAAQNQPPQEDPNMIFARAEEGKAQAEQMNAQNKQQEVQMNAQIKMKELEIKEKQIDLDTQKFLLEKESNQNIESIKLEQAQQKISNEYAIKLTDLELKAGKDLNASVMDNMLVFDPLKGDFI